MSTLPPVFVEFLASTAGFRAATSEVRGELATVDRAGGGTFAKVGKAAVVGFGIAAAAAVALGLKASAMAGDYQFQMNRLVHAAGELPANLKMVHDGILASMRATGTSMKDATDAMYLIESGGYHGAAGLKVLTAAEQGAAIEGANTGDVARALTGLLNDYHLKAGQAADTTSMLVSAVGHGMTTFQELALALPQVASQASQFHIKLNEVASALTTMTMHGLTASTAATYLRQMLGHLAGPATGARVAMKALGIDANKLGLTLTSGSGHGLYDAIKIVEEGIQKHLTPSGLVAMDVFKKSKGSVSDYQKVLANIPPTMITSMGALMKMTGGVKNFQGFLQLGGPNLKTYAKNAREIGAAAADAKGNVEGWGATQKTFNNTMKRLHETVVSVMIVLGEKLLPILTRVGGYLASHIGPAVHSVSAFFTEHKKIIALVAEVVGHALVTAFHALVATIKETVKVVSEVVGWFRRNMAVTVGLATFIGVLVAAMLLQKAAAIASAVATSAMATAQGILNAVMDANPIVLIVAALAGLVVGLIYAYNHSVTFRHIIADIGSVFMIVWQSVLKPIVDWFENNWKAALMVAVAVVAPFYALPIIIATHWGEILTFFKKLPDRIFGYLKDAGKWLLGIGGDILKGLLWGIETYVHLLWDFWIGLPLKLLGYVGDAGSWLFKTGAKLIMGLWNGLAGATGWLWEHIKAIPGDLFTILDGAYTYMLTVGKNLIIGIWNGVSNLASWLWDQVKGFLLGFVNDVKSFFGISSPSKLMADTVGKHIVTGMAKGIIDNRHHVKNAMQVIGQDVAGASMKTPGLNMTSGLAGAAGSGGAVTVINLTVQGTVQSETDLVNAIETGLLRKGLRRGTTYEGYRR